LALILLQRADPDGGGVDLQTCAHHDEAYRRMVQFWQTHTESLVLAYGNAMRQQATYRAGLLPSICAILFDLSDNGHGAKLPVRELLALIATYIIYPT
jgi:hypothetical protein